MRCLEFLYPALFAVSGLIATADAVKKPSNSVLLSNVKTLTLRKDLKTSNRRVSAIPQLKCIGGNAKGLYEIDILRCKNQGADYDEENIQWSCSASMPDDFKLGSTDVICEGYDSPDDPYILKGSCGVEYRLILTSRGEEKYGKGSEDIWKGFNDRNRDFWIKIGFWTIFFAAVCWILHAALFQGRRAGFPRPTQGNTWGWGGGGGGDDPPPPYDFRPLPKVDRSPNSRGESWRPGFWSGAIGGAAAGYMAGARGQRNQQSTSFWGNNRATGGGSSWGSQDRGSWSSGSSESSRSSGPSPRHESTGFGSTSRR
ncbi:MAG: hypothetical protein M1829_005892 [Trizodia sp. TS-e1964]|nr:MAG: hypothetical protein M1829_005892 [Trizodia sp. TS-e1964]